MADSDLLKDVYEGYRRNQVNNEPTYWCHASIITTYQDFR